MEIFMEILNACVDSENAKMGIQLSQMTPWKEWNP